MTGVAWDGSQINGDGLEPQICWGRMPETLSGDSTGREYDPRWCIWPDIDTWSLRPSRVVDVELPPCD